VVHWPPNPRFLPSVVLYASGVCDDASETAAITLLEAGPLNASGGAIALRKHPAANTK